jgi:hypothetical protein
MENSKENQPLYQKYAHLYAYDTQTKNHLLKSGILYKKRVAQDPQRFVESASMFSQPIKPIPEFGIEYVEQKVQTTQIGKSIPKPSPTDEQLKEMEKKKQEQIIRNQVHSIIKDEMRLNADLYKNKSANDVSKIFRDMLIEKLTKINGENNVIKNSIKETKKQKPQKQQNTSKKWNFKVNRQDENLEEDYYDDYISEINEDEDQALNNYEQNDYDDEYKIMDYY